VLPFFPVSFSLPMLHTYSFIYHSRCVIFFSQFSVLPYQIIPPMLHIHSVIYQRSFIIFFSRHFSFPCQYHSTNAPYSFIHLPPTLYNVFLSVIRFSLSVSFHQCSIFIHSSITEAINCFSPNTSNSPVSIIPLIIHNHSFIYLQRCIMFFSKYFSFPCQYHSTNFP